MNIRTSILITVFFLLFQINFAQTKDIKIECELKINQVDWKKESVIKAYLTVKNTLDHRIEINLPATFTLESQNPKSINPSGMRDIYRSGYIQYVEIKNKKAVIKTRDEQEFDVLLESGESKTVEFDLSIIGWKYGYSSISAYRRWKFFIPSNQYILYYNLSYPREENNLNSPLISIISNKITVNIINEK